jgi:chromate transport protein ChrA
MTPVHQDAEMSTMTREALAGSRWSRGQDFMGKRFALGAIRLMVSVNLLYAAIFAKFAGIPQSVALFMQMSQAVHGLIPQPVFRLGSGVFETTVAVLFLIPKTARLGARLVIVWMTAIILSHIFVLGYGAFFVDALVLMALAVIYLLLTRRHSHRIGAALPI